MFLLVKGRHRIIRHIQMNGTDVETIVYVAENKELLDTPKQKLLAHTESSENINTDNTSMIENENNEIEV
jgi:hypothetical protein